MKTFAVVIAAFLAVILGVTLRIAMNACMLMVMCYAVLPFAEIVIDLSWRDAFVFGTSLILLGSCMNTVSSQTCKSKG